MAPDGSVALSSSLASATQSAPLQSASAPGLFGGAGVVPGAGAGLGAGPTAAGGGGYAAVGGAAAVSGGAAGVAAGAGPLVQLQLQRTSSSSLSELALLGGAVSQTYERSGELPTEAVLSLLSALGEVSLRSLPTQVRNRGAQQGACCSRGLLQQGICCNRGLQQGSASGVCNRETATELEQGPGWGAVVRGGPGWMATCPMRLLSVHSSFPTFAHAPLLPVHNLPTVRHPWAAPRLACTP